MTRKDFLKYISALPVISTCMPLNALKNLTDSFGHTSTMPVLFVGHGSPMNAIENNEFTRVWKSMAKEIPQPKAILCISAHWETEGTWITAMKHPKTIHDFGGFPEALFAVQYPASGDPDLAKNIAAEIKKTPVHLDEKWGLDHGSWSVIKQFYPLANIPVLQLSIDYTKPVMWHYQLAQELQGLRNKGILIIGSGNMVHNLGKLNWNNDKVFDWAIEAHSILKKNIESKNHNALINYQELGQAIKLAIPTNEHYLPLLYTLALQQKSENIQYYNDVIDMGSIAMTSIKIA